MQEAYFVRGTHFPARGAQLAANQNRERSTATHGASTHRIDGAGADGGAKSSGGVEPGPSNDHGGDGACIDQVVVRTAPPRPSARDKDAVSHRVVNERRLPKPPKSQHWVWKHFTVCAKEALVNIAVCRICEANGDVDNAAFY